MLLAHLCWGGSGGIEENDTVFMLVAEVSNKKREQTGNPWLGHTQAVIAAEN